MRSGHPSFAALKEAEDNLPPEVYAEELVQAAIADAASDIFVTDEQQSVVIRVKRHGVIRTVTRLEKDFGRHVANHFQAVAGADIGDRHHPADGHYRVSALDGSWVDVRINVMPTVFGQDVTIRLFDERAGQVALEDLGLAGQQLWHLQRLIDRPSGLILVAGPTGSGKTTTLYACLRALNDGQRKIHTLEEPVEYVVPGLVQSEVNPKMQLDFDDLLYACLRQAPDVIMVGEVRDTRTAEAVVRAAGGGQLVLGTIHAQNCVAAIEAMLAYGTHPHFLAGSLVGVVAQRLVRRLCPACRLRVELPDLDRLFSDVRGELPQDEQPALYVPQGCESCSHDGYDRVCCLAETLEIDGALRHAIADGASPLRLSKLASESGMQTIARAAKLMVARGETTAEEVTRVLSPALFVDESPPPRSRNQDSSHAFGDIETARRSSSE